MSDPIATLRAAFPGSRIDLLYHPDADPGDGSGWSVEVGDLNYTGALADCVARHLGPRPPPIEPQPQELPDCWGVSDAS